MLHMPREEQWMLLALKEAEGGLEEGEEPVGTVIVEADSGRVVARAHQQVKTLADPTAHSLMIALTQLSTEAQVEEFGAAPTQESLAAISLEALVVVTTREPCIMCAGAMLLRKGVRALLYGESRGELGSCGEAKIFSNAQATGGALEVRGGIMRDSCRKVLSRYWTTRGAGGK